jgi:RNA polymerase sigma-70 factor (ECF subfamily)
MPEIVFAPTRWSLISVARGGADRPDVQRALAELCQLYWYPLYAFARRQGCTPEDAEDATQQFFTHALERHLFARADARRGKLRTFLLSAFQNDLADARKSAARQKRGGGCAIVSFDRLDAEERLAAEGVDPSTPDRQYEKRWALAVLEAAMARLAAQYAATGRAELFTALRPCLTSDAGPYEPICATLGLAPAAARQAVHRLRERFGMALRAEIAHTLGCTTDAAVDEELRTLRAALTGQG